MELSDQQVMLSLMNHKSCYSTHEFTNCYIWSTIKKNQYESVDAPDEIATDSARFVVEEHVEGHTIKRDSKKNKLFSSDQFTQYLHRGNMLKHVLL